MKVENGKRRTENAELKTENWKTLTSHLSPLNSIIQLEMGTYDYSLSEIARIVEENDVKILGLTVDAIPEEPGRIMVTLLVNSAECGAIIQSFYRYNYNIVNTFSSPDENSDLRDRYALLMRYLDV